MSCKKEKEPEVPNKPGGDPATSTNYKAEEDYKETLLNLNLDMVYVQGGTFDMGEAAVGYDWAQPVHKVTVSSYHIGKYEITQAQWKAVMGTSPSMFTGDNLPVEKVSWIEAKEFCDSLSKKTGKKYTLPTEGQWEFAARGGTKSKGYLYSGSNAVEDVAWYSDNSNSTTHAVGTKAANELGIYDMSGNVWEWCADWYAPYSSDAVTDPTGPDTGTLRVIRGACWDYFADDCRVSNRGGNYPISRENFIGFRVVCLP